MTFPLLYDENSHRKTFQGFDTLVILTSVIIKVRLALLKFFERKVMVNKNKMSRNCEGPDMTPFTHTHQLGKSQISSMLNTVQF